MPEVKAEKKQPIRTCIGTGVKKPKREMVRLVRLADGSVQVDIKGKLRGRGANIDSSIAAFDEAVKRGAIERALKLDYKLSKDQLQVLRKDFQTLIDERAFRPDGKPVTVRVKRDQLE